MEKHRISFSKQGWVNTGLSHPKRENPQSINCKRDPLADKQLAQQFMQSYMNINHLLCDTLCIENADNINKQHFFPLANHLNGYCEATRHQQVQAKNKLETIHKNHKKDYQNDTTIKTQPTNNDEESQFQNYLKQYETLVKNSRSKEFVSPMAHKKQIDDLITEFLSDMQESDIKSSEISPKNVKNKGNKNLSRQEKSQKSRNVSPEIVKIKTIDLSSLKANSYQNSYKKSNIKEMIKQQKQSSKKESSQKVSKRRQNYGTIQSISVQPRDYDTSKKQTYSRIQNVEKAKMRQKSEDKVKAEVINLEDLRKKSNGQEDRQLKYARKFEAMCNQQRVHQKSQGEKNSYLKQNLHKISKNDERKLKKQTPRVQSSQISVKQELQNKVQNIVAKKPLKIEIQISQYSSDEEQTDNPMHELEQQKIQIIRMISKKVTNMLQNTQQIALNKGK